MIFREPDNLFLMKPGALLQSNVNLAVKIHNWHQMSSSWDKPDSTFSIHQGLLDYVTFLGGPSDHPSATQVWNMARTQPEDNLPTLKTHHYITFAVRAHVF